MKTRFATLASIFGNDARVSVRLAREAQFDGLMFDAYSNALSIPELSQTGRREFRHTLAAHEIGLAGLQGDLGAQGLGPGADVDRVLDRIEGAMEAAAGLAAPLVCVDLGPLAEPAQPAKPKPTVTPEQAGLLILPTSVAAPEPPPAPLSPADQARIDSVAAALSELGRRGSI